MTALLDTSFLLALTNIKDRNYSRVLEVAKNIDDALVLPVTVLPEASYLIGSRLGYRVMQRFLNGLVTGNVTLETVTITDLKRVTEILKEYADRWYSPPAKDRFVQIVPFHSLRPASTSN